MGKIKAGQAFNYCFTPVVNVQSVTNSAKKRRAAARALIESIVAVNHEVGKTR
jgi:hypothetical protein